jgi:hypothetical protein
MEADGMSEHQTQRRGERKYSYIGNHEMEGRILL